MRRLLTLCALGMFVTIPVWAQDDCSSGRFIDTVFALTQLQRDTGIAYGAATDWLGAFDSLRLDIYAPKKSVDTMTHRPLVLCIHGGGFLVGNKGNYLADCIAYARLGFVAASIDYRLGWNIGTGATSPGQCLGDTLSLAKAVYRAYQDARAALRFLSFNARVLAIDTSWVILDGGSAGGCTVLGVAFADQADVDNRMPGLHAALGGLDSSTNNVRAGYRVRTVVSRWGALFDTLQISASENIPVIFFQGSNDSTVPYDMGPAYYCTAPVKYPQAFGSASLSRRLTRLGVCNQLYTQTGGGHGIANQAYIIPLSSCFIKSVMCGDCVSKSAEYGPGAPCQAHAGIGGDAPTQRVSPAATCAPRSHDLFDVRGRRLEAGQLTKQNGARVVLVRYGESIVTTVRERRRPNGGESQ